MGTQVAFGRTSARRGDDTRHMGRYRQRSNQGEITGMVTDSSGAPIAGATVTVTNTATRGMRDTTTNAEGLYTFPLYLPASMN